MENVLEVRDRDETCVIFVVELECVLEVGKDLSWKWVRGEPTVFNYKENRNFKENSSDEMEYLLTFALLIHIVLKYFN